MQNDQKLPRERGSLSLVFGVEGQNISHSALTNKSQSLKLLQQCAPPRMTEGMLVDHAHVPIEKLLDFVGRYFIVLCGH